MMIFSNAQKVVFFFFDLEQRKINHTRAQVVQLMPVTKHLQCDNFSSN